VTSWSRFDNEWEGVSFKHILSVVKPLSSAKFVLFKSFDDYTTNLPLEACDDRDVLLTYKWNGKPLTKDHGGPVRVIVPKRYAWKGAKWVKEISFSDRDEKGFWEVRGYSNSAFPGRSIDMVRPSSRPPFPMDNMSSPFAREFWPVDSHH
jgi:DMSO/TMAO reductase YedYZ molybdopterin-dependent catalytic subunit